MENEILTDRGAAFGKVIQGMDVVKKIQQHKDENQMLVEKVSLLKVELVN